jgi:hypothetical protein
MTVNKSQGQTFEHTAIYLEDTFLWTIIASQGPVLNKSRVLAHTIVYPVIFHDEQYNLINKGHGLYVFLVYHCLILISL